MPDASQWLSSTAGRRILDGYSWMQAVHWVAGSGLYQPRRHRSSGLRSFGATTVYIAQVLAELTPCFPGVEYLMRRTGLSERAVEYHLAALRETGLLAYVSRGTRVRGERAQASEFAWMIPVEFDVALGIRTAGEGTGRRVVGIAETGRKLMARLGKLAAKKVRRPRTKTAAKALGGRVGEGVEEAAGAVVSAGSRCTPMEGSSTGTSPTVSLTSPPESKLASGASKCPTPKKSKGKAAGGRRKLNLVGRRFRLAGELVRRVEWLRGCSVPRIAWVVRGVADAGWTSDEVLAWLDMRGTAQNVRRGSGLLAVLLQNAEAVLDTPAKRADAVEHWHGAEEARRRHRIAQVRASREQYEGDWQAPESAKLRREVEAVFAQALTPAAPAVAEEEGLVLDGTGTDEISAEDLAALIAAADEELSYGQTHLITAAIEALGIEEVTRIYGPRRLRRALQLNSFARSSLTAFGSR
ncbi:winged helix-turn-helix domain-containing protein [Streptomyces hydrogenans]|uniref:helix-turn-helix domain-containing protein n=1 Tax=Streptomyces hydrogenans TaxID=1873719 RepID=UPI00362FD08A